MKTNSSLLETIPFLFRSFEKVQMPPLMSGSTGGPTQYTTSSGGRETEYDDDPGDS
ncbi:hypothetical protein LDC_1498 [sediment metagenome]|uniref:Uncharacterized protein n=1 Tax=sediment metagenome TaxID=749907 RepID=D9PIY9_9ZZZZ